MHRTRVKGVATSVVLVGLIAASSAHASDVDILFPLQGLLFGLMLLSLLAPLLPLAPVGVVAALYALFVEGRKALGVTTLLLSSISTAAMVVLFNRESPGIGAANMVAIAVTLPATWVLLVHGMVRHWSAAKLAKAALVGVILSAAFLAVGVQLFNAATAPPPLVLDAG